eukprot:scaffold86895_cov34-Prasinocladus_malaysianus.AAC.2
MMTAGYNRHLYEHEYLRTSLLAGTSRGTSKGTVRVLVRDSNFRAAARASGLQKHPNTEIFQATHKGCQVSKTESGKRWHSSTLWAMWALL